MSNKIIVKIDSIDSISNKNKSLSNKELNFHIDKLSLWIKDNVDKLGFKGVVLGLSGGIDSLICALLSLKHLDNKNVHCIFIDIENNKNTQSKIDLISKTFGLNIKRIDLNNSFLSLINESKIKPTSYAKSLDNKSKKVILGNLKARLRMAILYKIAQENNLLVIGTSNLSEYTIGYFTKWGDSSADLYPILNFTKNNVVKIAKAFNAPDEIINSPYSADLWDNQTDEGELGFTYYELDRYLSNEHIDSLTKEKIIKLSKKNNHKIQYWNKLFYKI